MATGLDARVLLDNEPCGGGAEALAAASGGASKMGPRTSPDRSEAAALATAGEGAGKIGASTSPPVAAHWEFGD